MAAPVAAEEFVALMAPLGPFGPAPRLAVGVSGGPHSLALALLAARWARDRGGDALALVVDHGLRPGSGEEARGVVALLARAGMPVRMLPLGLPPGARLQERAREARLAALLDAAAEAGRPWLLLGHHRGDQAETLLFRALRGSGEEGLSAMRPLRVAAGALVLRPLLGIPAARLEAGCAAAGLDPVRDPSNADPRYARIRIRIALAAAPDGTEAVLAAAADAFGRRRAAQEAAIAERLAQAVTFRGRALRLDRAKLGRDATAVAALRRLVRLVGDARHAPAHRAVERLLARGGGTLGGCWLRPAGPGTWMLAPQPPDRGAAATPSVVLARPARLVYGSCDIGNADLPRAGAVT